MQVHQTRILTTDDLSKLFTQSMNQCIAMEDATKSDEEILVIIENLQEVQANIISLHIFSPNEDFEEILTENLRYLLLPYYMGDCFGKLQNPDTRKQNLNYCEIYLNEFYKLIDHYELVPKNIKAQYKKMKEGQDRKYQAEREDKIQNFKDAKEMNLKLKNLEKIDDDKSKREIIGVSVIRKLYSVIDLIPINWQEQEILDYRDLLQKDKNVAQLHNQEMNKPVPKMNVWNIPKPNEQNPYLMSKGQDSCHGCGGSTQAEQKYDFITKVWQPGPNMPTMTLDEFADGEMEHMKQQEDMQKRAMEEAKRQEEEEDPEKDQWSDVQTVKDRQWDDWKDANEKGAGNKNGR